MKIKVNWNVFGHGVGITDCYSFEKLSIFLKKISKSNWSLKICIELVSFL